MRVENFYSGEPVNYGSPPNFITEQEAVYNAGFGKYNYDPSIRNQTVYPGGYGYNMTNAGLGSYNPYQYNSSIYNPQFGNPVFQQQYQQSQPQIQEIEYFISPVNFSSEYLPSMDFEDRIDQLKIDYWMKEQEESVTNTSNYYSPFGCNNYYGVPFYNPYQYNSSLNSEISQKISEMEEEAKQNRLTLNLQLSRLAHNYSGDVYNDCDLVERYTGKKIENPSSLGLITTNELYTLNRFSNLVPFDNSQMYRDIDREASRMYNSIIPENSNMQECFENMGIVNAEYLMEEEKHRRRDGGALYNSDNNAYKAFVREKAAERYKQSQGSSTLKKMVTGLDQLQSGNMQAFPTLAQSAKLCDDGTLNISFGNFNSLSINTQEQEYEKDRERFNSFLNSIPGALYNPSGGDQ